MKDFLVSFPVKIFKFEQHEQLKQKTLEAINDQELGVSRIFDNENDVTRCDWGMTTWEKKKRDWVENIAEDLYNHLMNWCESLDYDFFKINEIWFQQYIKDSHHAWHVHGGNFSGVYYLELPEGSPKTEWIDPITKEIREFDVEEGDIVMFPSWLKHKSSENKSEEVKTIISWNLDALLKEKP